VSKSGTAPRGGHKLLLLRAGAVMAARAQGNIEENGGSGRKLAKMNS